MINATSDSPKPTTAHGEGKPPSADPELGCRLANLDWWLVASRLPYRSHIARLAALEAAGIIPNEANFARMASGLPR